MKPFIRKTNQILRYSIIKCKNNVSVPRNVKRRAIIRKLPAAGAEGRSAITCSDKTGLVVYSGNRFVQRRRDLFAGGYGNLCKV
jgi:hypothetical protein